MGTTTRELLADRQGGAERYGRRRFRLAGVIALTALVAACGPAGTPAAAPASTAAQVSPAATGATPAAAPTAAPADSPTGALPTETVAPTAAPTEPLPSPTAPLPSATAPPAVATPTATPPPARPIEAATPTVPIPVAATKPAVLPTTVPPTAVPAPPTATQRPAASGNFQAQVAQGARVYGQWCAGCHGAQAQGAPGSGIPRLAGAGKPLGNLGTVQGLLSFVRTNMPQDNPGSLSTEQYYAVTAYLLSLNGIGTGGEAVGPGTAGSISLR